MIVKAIKENHEMISYTHSQLNKDEIELNLAYQKNLVKKFIEEKRQKEKEEEEKGHFSIKDRPEFAIIGKKKGNRNWLDYSHNPKFTIELTKRIAKRSEVDRFLRDVEVCGGIRVFEKLRKGIIE